MPWRFVSGTEFQGVPARVPAPTRGARTTESQSALSNYRDVTLGAWPDNVMAKCINTSRSLTYEVKMDTA